MDKHVGTPAEVKAFIAAAHKRGMKVIFDVVANHTADVFDYAQGVHLPGLRPIPVQGHQRQHLRPPPVRGQQHVPADEGRGHALHAGAAQCVRRHETVSSLPQQPAQLSQPRRLHLHRRELGVGRLHRFPDDVFTEKPEVVKGFKDIFKGYVKNYGVDGFRIDTYKHVNIEFWQQVMPDVEKYAASVGKKKFYVFGEVASPTAPEVSWWSTKGNSGSMLDFAFQGAIRKTLSENAQVSTLADLFAQDDMYTTEVQRLQPGYLREQPLTWAASRACCGPTPRRSPTGLCCDG
ncbi:MAG: alpha-amylase family glycosyl hydrolase [Micropruina glycogenica]